MKYIIYTDGACSGNPGPGGWGAVILSEEKNEINIFGKEKSTTNNRMELMAPIMALEKIKKASKISRVCIDNYFREFFYFSKRHNWSH